MTPLEDSLSKCTAAQDSVHVKTLMRARHEDMSSQCLDYYSASPWKAKRDSPALRVRMVSDRTIDCQKG